MHAMITLALVAASLAAAQAAADTGRHAPGNALEREVAALFREQAGTVRCDASHFIFGVGYIDGSYMERIFYVEGSGDAPRFSFEFRGAGLTEPDHEDGPDPDVGPASFVIELAAPRSMYAVPDGDGWRVSDEGWETALRFKYTTWFGEVRRVSGRWQFDWQGYRRPMLPDSVTGNAQAICTMFSGR